MMAAISAFGYSISLVAILVALALVVGLALTVIFWLIIGASVYRSVQATRRERVRDELQDRLLDGVFSSNMDWNEWVDGLSPAERPVVESLLDEYLRELEGSNAESLHNLGAALGIPDRSRRWLERGGEYRRLHALTWLTLLREPGQLEKADFTPRTPRERASVVRLWHETGQIDDHRDGLSTLLADASSQFTVFGQDTLYRIAVEEPGALFAISAANYRTWSEPLLVQVLVVCQHLGTSITTENLSWLTANLEHESETVRAATARALGTVGWREDVRDGPFLTRLAQDPSPEVRGAVYRMLAEWGDRGALDVLKELLESEDDPRARLAGTNALVRQEGEVHDDVSRRLTTTMAWSVEHAEYDSIARQRSRQVSD
jgi:hypothetical protein